MVPNLVSHELKYLLEFVSQGMGRFETASASCIHIVMQHSHVVDMKNDWKLMTILVGANGVCLGLVNSIESRSESNRLGSSRQNYVVVLEMCQP